MDNLGLIDLNNQNIFNHLAPFLKVNSHAKAYPFKSHPVPKIIKCLLKERICNSLDLAKECSFNVRHIIRYMFLANDYLYDINHSIEPLIASPDGKNMAWTICELGERS